MTSKITQKYLRQSLESHFNQDILDFLFRLQHLIQTLSCLKKFLKIHFSFIIYYFLEEFSRFKFVLELRQYKIDSIWSKDKSALNLPRFFTRLYGQWKRATISKLICLWTKWCRSYFVFTLDNDNIQECLTRWKQLHQIFFVENAPDGVCLRPIQ